MERIESQIGGVRDGPLPTSCYDEQSEHEVTASLTTSSPVNIVKWGWTPVPATDKINNM